MVRLYDLGEDLGMRFITMELVDGRDLRSILQERRTMPPDEAVEIFKQIAYALQAAHTVGILHRDLKPQNIMLEDSSGRVVTMDFGLARTIEGDGMTQTGALVGTMEYMSPEQALARNSISVQISLRLDSLATKCLPATCLSARTARLPAC